ncbi:MAG: hypothetical protein ACYC7D_12385 [Nitrososphaerales archaeon]
MLLLAILSARRRVSFLYAIVLGLVVYFAVLQFGALVLIVFYALELNAYRFANILLKLFP